MTTIAYRDGVMAADSGTWMGDASAPWARKLALGSDGTLYGVAGDAALCQAFIEWVESGCEGDRPEAERVEEDRSSYIVMAVARGGPVRIFTATGHEVYHAPYFAIGGGNVGAMCAMHAGADAVGAIEASIAHAPAAIGPVQSIKHGA